jgi:hypothetical protein
VPGEFVGSAFEPKSMETKMSESKDCKTCKHANKTGGQDPCHRCVAFASYEVIEAVVLSSSLERKMVAGRLQTKWNETVALCKKHGITPVARHAKVERYSFAFDDDVEAHYSFPIGVLGGKVVYDGDTVYGGHDGKLAIIARKGIIFTKADGGVVDLTWTPRVDTKPVMIGGLTYRAPQATNEGIIGGGVLNSKIHFATTDDAAKAGEIIQKLFGVKL